MKIDIEVISRDMIKPSTTTPPRSRNYQFSLLDQIAPPEDFSFIYFFNLDCKLSNNDISNHLKTSLSKVLTHYYLLAGRVNDNYVDCNDEDVLFLVFKSAANSHRSSRNHFWRRSTDSSPSQMVSVI
ncbi:hypothetical protein LWI29_019773 [Acer saccharum]|uniref:Uncharacterized protein n=1 Tax=Acer saccharum TaxID=4024 RepID=A0AA39T4A8_ACESA|nr:hypothetical protein LWI29_019773 [Acer saccharum]